MNCSGGFISSYDTSLFSASKHDADLVWNTQRLENIIANNFSQSENWLDAGSGKIGLYPPLRLNSTSLDFEKAPLVEEDLDGKVYLNFKDKKELRTLTENIRTFSSDNYTVAFFINSVDVVNGQYKTTRVFDLLSPNGASDGYVGVDVSATQVSTFYWFGADSYYWLGYDVTSEDLEKGLAVILRTGPDHESMALSVNGKLAEIKSSSAMLPPRLANVGRHFRLNTEYASVGFNLYEIAVWFKPLSDQTLNEYSQAYYNSYVLGLSGAVGGGSGGSIDDGFAKVFSVLNKSRASGSCVSCHGSIAQKSGFLSITSMSSGEAWVKKGDAANSLVIKAIRRQQGALAMPPSGNQLPEDEILTIENWINGIK